jgi:hypothetical protein
LRWSGDVHGPWLRGLWRSLWRRDGWPLRTPGHVRRLWCLQLQRRSSGHGVRRRPGGVRARGHLRRFRHLRGQRVQAAGHELRQRCRTVRRQRQLRSDHAVEQHCARNWRRRTGDHGSERKRTIERPRRRRDDQLRQWQQHELGDWRLGSWRGRRLQLPSRQQHARTTTLGIARRRSGRARVGAEAARPPINGVMRAARFLVAPASRR